MAEAATWAFGLPISASVKRNWRFKFVNSMVSMSTMWRSGMPKRAKVFTISHPSPPAPRIRILTLSRLIGGEGVMLLLGIFLLD